uniref:Uncharacterized protein n=1 Tax=Schistosoma haematobium TaxID=6185 RepID=A0A095BT06_SCHHA
MISTNTIMPHQIHKNALKVGKCTVSKTTEDIKSYLDVKIPVHRRKLAYANSSERY